MLWECINNLKVGKAAGVDGLCAKIIKCLPMYDIERLNCLFNTMLKVRYTTDNFSLVCLVSILKDKNGDTTRFEKFGCVAIASV